MRHMFEVWLGPFWHWSFLFEIFDAWLESQLRIMNKIIEILGCEGAIIGLVGTTHILNSQDAPNFDQWNSCDCEIYI